MARRSGALRSAESRDLGFCQQAASGDALRASILCHSAPPRPLSGDSDVNPEICVRLDVLASVISGRLRLAYACRAPWTPRIRAARRFDALVVRWAFDGTSSRIASDRVLRFLAARLHLSCVRRACCRKAVRGRFGLGGCKLSFACYTGNYFSTVK